MFLSALLRFLSALESNDKNSRNNVWKELWKIRTNGIAPVLSCRSIARLIKLTFTKVLLEAAGDEITVAGV